jgi:hypothetical protein
MSAEWSQEVFSSAHLLRQLENSLNYHRQRADLNLARGTQAFPAFDVTFCEIHLPNGVVAPHCERIPLRFDDVVVGYTTCPHLGVRVDQVQTAAGASGSGL